MAFEARNVLTYIFLVVCGYGLMFLLLGCIFRVFCIFEGVFGLNVDVFVFPLLSFDIGGMALGIIGKQTIYSV